MKTKSFALVLAAFSLTLVAHAATVEWTSGDLDVSSLEPISSVDAYYYVINGDSASELASKFVSGNWSTSDLVDNKGNLKSTYAKDVTTTASSPSDVTVAKNGNIYTANWNQNFTGTDEYVVAVYVANTVYGGSYAVATIGHYEADPSNVLEGYNTQTSSFSGIGEEALNYAAQSGSAWTAVPEPTTVALLAIGLAAVGLKRKIA